MDFQKFNKIPRLSRDMVITEKLDGCFDYNSRILTDMGYECIGKIVNQKLKRKVLTYNFKNKIFEYILIQNYFKKESTYKDFLHIKLKGFKRGNAYYSFRCTKNHLIYTNHGWKRADELTLKDKVISPNNDLDYIQKQMILGTLLGDATICQRKCDSCGYSHSQTIKNKQYTILIHRVLGRFFKSQRITKGGYANTDILHINSNFDTKIQEFLNLFLCKGKKYFSKQILNELSPISLAFWFMDDGSCSLNDKQNPRITLHTQGFSKTQINLLLDSLYNKFNFQAKAYNYGKGFQITINSIDTEKFLNLVSSYITKDMQYKLPEELRHDQTFWNTYKEDKSILYEQDILEIKDNTKTGNNMHYKYDIETKNHNYIISGIIVHNSNAQIWVMSYESLFNNYNLSDMADQTSIDWVHGDINNFIDKHCLINLEEQKKKDLYENMKDQLFIFAGSRKKWLDISSNGDNFGFAKWVKTNTEELILLGEGRHYGEWMGKGIQRNYGLDEKRFYLFNMHKWCEWDKKPKLISVDPKTKEEKYQTKAPKCCYIIPAMYRGLFRTDDIEHMLEELQDNGSYAVPEFMNPEGIIIYHTASGRLFKKTILNDEKPKEQNDS